MLRSDEIEQLINTVAVMDRHTLVESFLNFRGNFPTDFTEDFLDRQPLDRLRHIYVALCIQTNHRPDEVMV